MSELEKPAVTTAAQLWEAFEAQAGLSLTPSRKGVPGYDAALAEGIRNTLRFGPGPIGPQLARAATPLEDLLNALLCELQPWSRMMREVLEILREASAQHAGAALELEVRFDDLDPGLRTDLEAFRRQADGAEEVVAQRPGRLWGQVHWQDVDVDLGLDANVSSHAPPPGLPADLRAWVDRYAGGERPPVPPLPPTGHAAYDAVRSDLLAWASSALAAMRSAGVSASERYAAYHREPSRDFGHGWTAQGLWGADSDFLVGSVLMRHMAAPRARTWDRGRAAEIAERVGAALAAAPPGPPGAVLVNRLLDLLDLPVWKRRHELYSVWIAALMRQAWGERPGWSWHAPDGVLSFAFGGSHIATVSHPEDGAAEVWAELRRPVVLTTPSRSRKANVQPDYTVLVAADRASAPAGLVVECKQYRRPSRRNFTSALRDYATAHEEAAVALVNYGPAGAAAEDAALASEDRVEAVAALGDVHPLGGGREAACAWLEDHLVNAVGHAHFIAHGARLLREAEAEQTRTRAASVAAWQDAAAPVRGEVTLVWRTGGDLDLHVSAENAGRRDEISFSNLGALSVAPFIRHGGDLLQPGTEVVRIGSPREGRCAVAVQVYSGPTPQPDAVEVTVRLDERTQTFRPPHGAWMRWEVCSVDFDRGTIAASTGESPPR
jgi:hypothetical protein